MKRFIALIWVLAAAVLVCSCNSPGLRQSACEPARKVKAVVITGGHGFKAEPFFAMFDSFRDVEYVEARQKDHSEIFEDISNWNYDVIVFYSMTQEISPRRRQNLQKLVQRGIGVVALHHSVGAFQQWGEFRKIIGGKFYLKEMSEDGTIRKKSSYKDDIDLAVHIEDSKHPITRGMKDFVINDEAYKDCVFEKDNRVLLTTEHPASDKPLCWVRQYEKARVCCIQLGHGPAAYANPNYRQLVAGAIKWCGKKAD